MQYTLPDTDIASRYKAGETIAQIAADFGCSDWTIKHRLRRQGVSLRRRGPARTYPLNEEFFDNINTEAQAYWLGFILADGRTSQTGAGNWVTRVDLGVEDVAHLSRLLQAVGSNAPVKSGHEGESAYIDLCSVKLCKALVALECGPFKTGNHGTPFIPPILLRHFYRGYSDGDGSIYPIPQLHAWRYDAIGAPKFIEQFQQWLMPRAAVKQTKLIQRPPVTTMRYTGGSQIERICRVLYRDATIYLPRKFEMFQQLLERPKR